METNAKQLYGFFDENGYYVASYSDGTFRDENGQVISSEKYIGPEGVKAHYENKQGRWTGETYNVIEEALKQDNDENRISDLIDGGLHDKSAIDRAKYELHMRRIAAIDEAATKSWEDDAKYNPNPDSPYAYRNGFKAGAKEVIEHPERYGLTARKPLGIQEARELVNQMLAEEISFSRFVELINEGSTK